jgi:hypothetical protein
MVRNIPRLSNNFQNTSYNLNFLNDDVDTDDVIRGNQHQWSPFTSLTSTKYQPNWLLKFQRGTGESKTFLIIKYIIDFPSTAFSC